MNNLWTLENIKSAYYVELAIGIESRGFDEYLKEHFVQVYDKQLNFIGWEQKLPDSNL